MVENESCKSLALSSLPRYLQSKAFSDRIKFEFVVHGNEIPKWYNHQTVGSSITVKLHPGWFTNKFMGFTTCVVCRLLKPLPPLVQWSIDCSLRANGQSWVSSGLVFGAEWGQPVGDHIWFFYKRRDQYSQELQDIRYELEFSYKHSNWMGKFHEEIMQVKKCGVRVVYEDDVKELWQTLLKQSNTKRGYQHSVDDDDGDGASSSASQAHPKRTKQLHLDGS